MKPVKFSPKAQEKLDNLLDYLESEWGEGVKQKFIDVLDQSIAKISNFPESCPSSKKKPKIYKCVVTYRCVLFYRIQNNMIEVTAVLDTRQDRNEYE
mgnify:CR=1 FL=1